MNNVLIQQTSNYFTGTLTDPANTAASDYGYFGVPLNIRNTKYPPEFANLPSAQVHFSFVDDEVDVYLGSKIDHKDFIKYLDSNGSQTYSMVNTVTRYAIQHIRKYRGVTINENGTVNPPPGSGPQIKVIIPRISVTASDLASVDSKFAGNTNSILLPMIIPVININGTYLPQPTNIAIGTNVTFQVVVYEDLFRRGTRFAAVNTSAI